MNAILRKALADLRTFRLQSALILVIVAAAVVTLTLSLLIRQSANTAWDRAFAEANGPDVVYYAASNVDLSKVAGIQGVTQVSPVFPTFWDSAVIQNDVRYDVVLFGLGPALPTMNRPLMMQGSWLTSDGTNQIVLEQSFAQAHGITSGDVVTVSGPTGITHLTVVGLAVSLSRGPYPDWSTAVSWVLPDTLARLAPDQSTWTNAIAVKVADPANSTAYAAQVNALFPNQQVYGNDDWHEVQSAFNQWNQVISIFLGVFSIFAIIAVAFVIANAIGGRVLAQYREIGLMKATGFTPAQVTNVFLLQHVLLGLVGAAVGIGLGTLLAPSFLDHTASLLGEPVATSFNPVLSLVILTGVLFLVVFFTLLPAWRGARISTVQAITTGFSPAQSRPSLLSRVALWLRLPLAASVGIKDVFSRPARAAFTIAALAMTVVTVTFALGTEAMIEQLVHNPALNAQPYDLQVSRNALSDRQASALLAQHPEIRAEQTVGSVETRALNVPGSSGPISFQTWVFGGDYQEFPYAIGAGRMLAASNEAMAGAGLLKLLHVKVGQDVTVVIDQHPVTLHLVGRVVESEDEGQILIVRDDALKSIDPHYSPDRYLLLLKPGADPAALQHALLQESNYGLSVEVRSGATSSVISTIHTVLLGLSAALLVIGLANLLTTTLLNVRERSRDVGVFKAIGMTPGQILGSVISGVSVLALIAVAVGIPLGIEVYKEMFHVVAEHQMGADPLLFAAPHIWWLVLMIPGAIAVSALASALPAWRASRVDVVEALRTE